MMIVATGCGGQSHAPEKPAVHPVLRDLHQAHVEAASSERVKIAPASASPITFARMAKHPEPGWNVPRNVQHAPDGNTVTYLASESGDETMSLMSFDTMTGTSSVLLRAKDLAGTDGSGTAATPQRSREEELRRERQRDRNEGITSYSWAKKAKVFIVPHAGDIFVRDLAHEPGGSPRRLTKTPEPEIDPALCETGERVAFVRKGELYSIDVATGKETALTIALKDAKTNLPVDGVTHGLSDFVAQEELGESSGFFWSPKCDRIVYLEVDERSVDKLPVLGYRGEADLMMQRYPRAGTKNPIVRAGIVDLATRKTTWLDPGSSANASASAGTGANATTTTTANAVERYLGHFLWSDDGQTLFLQTLTRDQKRLTLVRVDPKTGKTTEVLTESSPAWVSFSPMRLPKKIPDAFLFTSTKTGHRHLELRSHKDGSVLRTLTSGDWDAQPIAIDDAGDRVLFSGTNDGVLERHLYSVPLKDSTTQTSVTLSGTPSATTPTSLTQAAVTQTSVSQTTTVVPGKVTRLTTERGLHTVRVNETGTTWVDVHSAGDRLPRAIVVREGKPVGELPVMRDPDLDALGIRPVEHVTVNSKDGGEVLHGALLKPRTITGRHPVIVMVYGGPEAQLVWDSWQPRLLWQHLADRGFVVFQLDNRGSGGRGPAFAQKVHKQLGRLELEDQVAGARWLATQPFVDPERIGIYGHSYGGFMAALAMLDASSKGVFKAGVAGSPVTDWRLYDTGYTERYMETPTTNAAGYEASDLSKKASGLTGKLLITHAMMDENVHYAHTAKLVDALIAADKHFDLLVLPGERHGLRSPAARVYIPERVAGFFAENL